MVSPLLGAPRGLRGMLLGAGVERVVLAEEGASALTALAAEPVDIIFATWEKTSLPYRDILAFLRKKGRHRRIPVVLLNSGMSPQDVVAAVKAGVADLLEWPAQSQAIGEMLSRLKSDQPVAPRSHHGT